MDGSEDCYYFCHICNHHRVREEVLQRASGDLVCMVCDNEGFVEKMSAPMQPEVLPGFTSFQTNAGGFPVITATSFDSSSDPFISALGMPMTNFVQQMFRGIMNPTGATGPRASVRFQTTTLGGGMPFEGFFEGSDPNIQSVFQSFMQNPLDPQAMNQFLYYVMESDPNRQGSPPVARIVLENLETETLDEEQAKKLETCAICTEDFAAGDRIHWLSSDRKVCGHAFHVDCIVPWLKQHNSCPVCRYELPTDDEEYNRQREELRSRLVEEVQRHVDPSTQGNNSQQPERPDTSQGYPRRGQPGNGNNMIRTNYCHVQ